MFFDAVGTLIHPTTAAGEVYAAIGRRWGATLEPAEIDRRFRAAFHRQEELDRQLGYRTNEVRERQRWRSIVTDVFCDQPDPEGPLDELWDHFARPDAWACFPDVAPCLETLDRLGLQLGIASNYDARLRSVVAGLPELRRCEHLVISAEVGWRKPSPQFFQALLEKVQRPSDQVLLVGDDWENDYQGGLTAGLQAVFLRRHALAEVPTLDTLLKLPVIVGAHPGR